MKLHKCAPEYSDNKDNIAGYDSAINSCYENELGEYWAGNNEYESRVNFCPYCGSKAPRQIITNPNITIA